MLMPMNDLIVLPADGAWDRLKKLVLDTVASPITPPRLRYGARGVLQLVSS
jgi:hypothetical protein